MEKSFAHLHLVAEPTADHGLKLPWRPLSQPGAFKGQTAILAWRVSDEDDPMPHFYLDYRCQIEWTGEFWVGMRDGKQLSPDGRDGFWLAETLLFELRIDD